MQTSLSQQLMVSLKRTAWCLGLGLGLWMGLGIFLSQAFAQDTTTPTTTEPPVLHRITVMHTSDLYGRLRDFRCKRPGAKGYEYTPAKHDLSNLLYQVRKIQGDVDKKALRSQMQMGTPKPGEVKTAGWLLFNTGDNLATDLTARFLLEFQGISGVDFMADVFGRFSYQLVGIGNHEFSVSPEKLQEFLEQASLQNIKFAVANLEDGYEECLKENKSLEEQNKQEKDRTRWQPLKKCVKYPPHALMRYVGNTKRYHVFNKGGLRIGVFHLVAKDLQKEVSSRSVRGIVFSDPAQLAGQLAEKLRNTEKVDLVVMMSHIESSSTGGKAIRDLVAGITDENQRIDVVITNEWRDNNGNPLGAHVFDKKGNGTYIVGAAAYGSQLGRFDVVIEKTGTQSRIVSFQAKSIPADDNYEPELRRELIKWERSYCKRWGTPLGVGKIRTQEGMTRDQFIIYLLNLMRYMTGAEVAIINDGAVRNGPFFPLKGYITKDDLYRTLPFNGSFEILRLTGAQLTELLKFADDSAKGRKLRFMGAEGGNVNGRNVENEAYYNVATISYVANNSGSWLDKPTKLRKKFYYHRVMYQGNMTRCSQENIKRDLRNNGLLRQLCTPRTRDTMQLHFETNGFRKLPPTPPPPPDGMGMTDRGTSSATKLAFHPPHAVDNWIPLPTSSIHPRAGQTASATRTRIMAGTAFPAPKSPVLARACFASKHCQTSGTPPTGTPTPSTTPPTDPGTSPGTTSPPGGTPTPTTPTTPTTPPKPPKPKPFGPDEIPYPGTFLDLRDHVAWRFKTNLAGGFTSIFINPTNIGQFYSQHETLSGGFYQKLTIEGEFGMEFQLDTRVHLWKTKIGINYNADLSWQFGNDPPAPIFPSIFQESNDRLLVTTEYQLRYFSALFQQRKWYHTDPFFQLGMETELTTGPRPDLGIDALFAAGTTEVFHHLRLDAKAGLSFQFTDKLTFKVGFTAQKEIAPYTRLRLQGCTPSPTQSCIDSDPRKLSINTDWNLGFSAEYELSQWEIVTIGKTPFSWASKAEYRMTFLVGGGEALDIHDLRMENTFSFNIVGQLSLSFGFKFYLFRGIFKPVQDQNVFIRGPIAFRIDPFIRLNFQWGTRGQLF